MKTLKFMSSIRLLACSYVVFLEEMKVPRQFCLIKYDSNVWLLEFQKFLFVI
jgi:hypothetical protein